MGFMLEDLPYSAASQAWHKVFQGSQPHAGPELQCGVRHLAISSRDAGSEVGIGTHSSADEMLQLTQGPQMLIHPNNITYSTARNAGQKRPKVHEALSFKQGCWGRASSSTPAASMSAVGFRNGRMLSASGKG